MARACVLLFLAAIFLVGAPGRVSAVPLLQIYLEGADYDSVTESWVLTPQGSSGGAPFRLWVIGNVDGPGGSGTVFDVKLSVSYDEQFSDLGITLQSSTTNGFGGIADPSTPDNAIANQVIQTSLGEVDTSGGPNPGLVTNGSIPLLADGRVLPSHGNFGDGIVWREFLLGDLDLTDSPVADFIDDFPTTLTADAGQINVYEISVTDGGGATLHFDAYNHVEGKNKGVFAPFSHDGDGDVNVIPEPSTLTIWPTLLAVCWLGWGRRRFRRRRAG